MTATSADASVVGPSELSRDGTAVGDEGDAEGTCSVGSVVGVGVADVAEADGVAEGVSADAEGVVVADSLADAEGDAVSLSFGVGLSLGLTDGSVDAVTALVGGLVGEGRLIGAVVDSWRDLLGDGEGSACASLRNGGGVTASLISSGTVSHAADTPMTTASG